MAIASLEVLPELGDTTVTFVLGFTTASTVVGELMGADVVTMETVEVSTAFVFCMVLAEVTAAGAVVLRVSELVVVETRDQE